MQILRVVIWVLLLVGLLLFSIFNWTDVTVRIWQGIVVDTKIPAIVIVSFAIGFVPMWLYHRASKWGMQRKIHNLENAARTQATTPVAPREDTTDETVHTDHVSHADTGGHARPTSPETIGPDATREGDTPLRGDHRS